MSITKIVVTGGPCGGKTTALERIRAVFSRIGYTVLVISETATEFISGGVAPWTCGTNADYQLCQMSLQLEKERLFRKAAESMSAEKILIVCDRGALDNKAYMTDDEFRYVLDSLSLNEVELRDGYDGVFHLTTTAKGAEEFYTTKNNMARVETLEEAKLLDDKLISSWVGHPHMRVIDNSTDFEGKLERLMREIEVLLGEPEPFEIERKFLIEYPDTDKLPKLPECCRVEISQTYLEDRNGERFRVRRRGCDGNFIYFHTVKKKVSAVKRIEIERRITEEEYTAFLESADHKKRQISKDRYCLVYDSKYFEIDIFPFRDDIAVMEIELSDENEEIRFPDWIKIIKEVTGERKYNNYELATPV